METSGDEFRPTATLEMLRGRAALLRRLRALFDGRGFLEVTTPCWSRDCVVDRHLDPVAVPLAGQSAARPVTGYLQTSPEQHMKRLLASGAEAIYQVTPVFRAGERGPLHNPEFTMVEWYRVGDDLRRGIELLSDLTAELLSERPRPQVVSYREAFLRHAGIDPFTADTAQLLAAARTAAGLPESELADADRDLLLDLILVHLVEPQLGREQPQIVVDYPTSQAALAQLRTTASPHDGATSDSNTWQVAERFELYVDGVELANGYHELLDPDELLRRTDEANRHRRQFGKEVLATPQRLVAAMRAGLPPCCGVALGIDRLAMVALGASSIDQVITFPWERA